MQSEGIASALDDRGRGDRTGGTSRPPRRARARALYVPGASCIDRARLDRCLEFLARRPERFRTAARGLAAALDARGLDLELADPGGWRAGSGSRRVGVERQLALEIGNMRKLGRAEERLLALRIEFARIRLERAERRLDLARRSTGSHDEFVLGRERRRREWHALRVEMVERNLYLVLINVERYRHTSVDRGDLVQAAATELFRAVDRFDWRRGVLFGTYAVHWVKQGFRSQLYQFGNTVYVPTYLQRALSRASSVIRSGGNPTPSIDELARVAGLRRELVAAARSATRRPISIEAPLDGSDGARTIGSQLTPPDQDVPEFDGHSPEAAVGILLEVLDERERRVVRMRFGIGYSAASSYAGIALELGVSVERVRQILVRALSKLRTDRLRRRIEPLIL